MIRLTPSLLIAEDEVQLTAVRAQGAGGQNVNKLSTAVQLRFDVRCSPSLPNDVAIRLMRIAGSRMTKDGVLVIIAQNQRTQERNRADARERLIAMIQEARDAAEWFKNNMATAIKAGNGEAAAGPLRPPSSSSARHRRSSSGTARRSCATRPRAAAAGAIR